MEAKLSGAGICFRSDSPAQYEPYDISLTRPILPVSAPVIDPLKVETQAHTACSSSPALALLIINRPKPCPETILSTTNRPCLAQFRLNISSRAQNVQIFNDGREVYWCD